MDYIIVAFRSRNETIQVNRYLSNHGIFCEVVNTPKQAGVGCGLSVKIMPNTFQIVKNIIFSANLKTFAGFFAVSKGIGGIRVSSM